jgi:uncharacterized protein YdbL (DUF1318 family)
MSQSHPTSAFLLRRGLVFFASVFALSLAGSALAAGQATSDQLRREGRACEQQDGFLRALNPDAQAAVADINAARRRVYEQRATQENVDIAAAALVFAEQIRREPTYVACPN